MLSCGETPQRGYFGRRVWSDPITMSSHLLPGTSHQLEPAWPGRCIRPSHQQPFHQTYARKSPENLFQRQLFPLQERILRHKQGSSWPRIQSKSEANQSFTGLILWQDFELNPKWYFSLFWSIAAYIYLDNLIPHKSHSNLTNHS